MYPVSCSTTVYAPCWGMTIKSYRSKYRANIGKCVNYSVCFIVLIALRSLRCSCPALPVPHLPSLALIYFSSPLLPSYTSLLFPWLPFAACSLLYFYFHSLPFLSLASLYFLPFSLLSLLPYTSLAFPSPLLSSSSLPSLPLPSFAFHLTYNIINICIVWRVYKQNFTLAQTIAKIP